MLVLWIIVTVKLEGTVAALLPVEIRLLVFFSVLLVVLDHVSGCLLVVSVELERIVCIFSPLTTGEALVVNFNVLGGVT